MYGLRNMNFQTPYKSKLISKMISLSLLVKTYHKIYDMKMMKGHVGLIVNKKYVRIDCITLI